MPPSRRISSFVWLDKLLHLTTALEIMTMQVDKVSLFIGDPRSQNCYARQLTLTVNVSCRRLMAAF